MDRLIGEKIYAEFRNFQTQDDDDSVDGIKRKKCIQINNFFCMIQKPVRKNKEYQKN